MNSDKERREICLRYVDLVIRGEGYAHELASKIADQKKKKEKNRTRVRREPNKNICAADYIRM